ncbi:MAG: GxxExxY protein [Thermoplasmatota archaeon]
MRRDDLSPGLNAITGDIVDCAYRIHRTLGSGLLEHAYVLPLARLLVSRGRIVEREVPLDIEVDGVAIRNAFRIDILVDGSVIAEAKAVDEIHPRHLAQLTT